MRKVAQSVQVNCALGAVVLSPPLVAYLPKASWQVTKRLRRYSRNGCILTILGLALMYVFVTHMSVNVFLAQAAIVPIIMALVSHKLHSSDTFGDRDVAKHSGRRFVAVRLSGMGLSKISFVLLVGVMGMQYLLASLLIVLGLAYPTYRLNRDWAFRPEAPTPDSLRGQIGATLPIVR